MGFGLPSQVRACLFDLDGVLTPTAKVHAAAWKEMFDEYLRGRARRDGRGVRAVRRDRRLRPVRRRQATRRRHALVPRRPRASRSRKGAPNDPPDAETVRGLGNRKNEIVMRLLREKPIAPYAGSVRYVHAVRGGGLRTAVVSSSRNCRLVLASAGITDSFEAIVDGVVARDLKLAGKPAPDTYLAAARMLGVSAAQSAVFEDALAGVEAGRNGGFGSVVGVDRVGQRAELLRHGANLVVKIWPSSSRRHDPAPRVSRRAVGAPRDPPRPRHPGPERVAVRALQRPHWTAREPRRGRAARPPRIVPQRLLRAASTAVCRSAVTASPSRARRSSTSPTGSCSDCSSTTSRSTCATANSASHDRVLDFRAGTLTRRAEWTSPAGRTVRVTSVRMVSFTQRVDRRDRLRGRAARRSGQSRRPVGAGGQRAAAGSERGPAGRGGARVAARARGRVLLGCRGRPHPPDEAEQACGSRRRWTTSSTARRVSTSRRRRRPTLPASRSTDVLEPGQRLRLVKLVAYGWSSDRTVPALRDQVAAALEAARLTGWEGLLADQRRYLDAFWARADVEVEGDAELQQAVRFALFHVLQAAARAERRAIPAKGLTGTGYDGHSFWDTETFVLPVLTHTVPAAAADALRWRHATLPMARARARELAPGGRSVPLANDSRRGMLGLLAGRDRRLSRQRGHRRRRSSLRGRHGRRRVRARRRRRSSSSRRPGCGAVLGHHDVGGSFRIDGVTGPDEYSAIADNNVYTNLMARRNLLGAADGLRAASGQGP